MTAILHLTDTHLADQGAKVSGRLETVKPLEVLVERIGRASVQWPRIDAVLVTGDVSDDGSTDSYMRFRSLLAPLEKPIYVIPGNHDSREHMRNAFLADGYLPTEGPLNWYREIGDLSVIGLDTLVEGKGHGLLTDDTLAFLDNQLLAARDRPVLIALHHPPFRTGIAFMDAISLQNADVFSEVIARAQGVVRILCGHIHSLFMTDVCGHVALSAPSPCSNFELDVRADAPVGYFDRDDGCLLHVWDNRFTSIRIGPQAGSGPHPFT